MIYNDHYYFAFTTLALQISARVNRARCEKRSGNLYRHFIKANTRGAALGSTIKEYYLRTTMADPM